MQKVADGESFTETLNNKEIHSEILVHPQSNLVLENLHDVNSLQMYSFIHSFLLCTNIYCFLICGRQKSQQNIFSIDQNRKTSLPPWSLKPSERKQNISKYTIAYYDMFYEKSKKGGGEGSHKREFDVVECLQGSNFQAEAQNMKREPGKENKDEYSRVSRKEVKEGQSDGGRAELWERGRRYHGRDKCGVIYSGPYRLRQERL